MKMSFKDAIKKSVLEGFVANDISLGQILIVLGVTFIVALYIFMVYKYVMRNSFYDINFNVSMAIISVVTAGILLAMQSNLVISLGMVGALSIVRFRTAIKDPLDLLFLFWSIGTGIICGAGLFEIAIIVAIAVTIGMIILQMIPTTKSPYLLVINAVDVGCEGEIMDIVKNVSKSYRVDSKTISNGGMDLIIEIRTTEGNELVNKILSINGVDSVSLLYHDGTVKS